MANRCSLIVLDLRLHLMFDYHTLPHSIDFYSDALLNQPIESDQGRPHSPPKRRRYDVLDWLCDILFLQVVL